MDVAQYLKVQELNARYVRTIDQDRLEAWPDFFTEDARYRIITVNNLEQGLPLGMRALREANVYEAQRYRHIIGPPLINAT